MSGKPFRLAVVISHPTQYYSPWFRYLAMQDEVELKVFYLWDSGVTTKTDRTFGATFSWDIPLLDGYQHQFLPNRATKPGTHHPRGLDNPTAVVEITRWQPDGLLMFGYTYLTHLRLMLSPGLWRTPFYFRGDSHDLYRVASWKQAVGRTIRRTVFRRFSAFLAVGKANQRYFERHGVAPEKITRVPHCVDNQRFRSAAATAELQAQIWKRDLGIPEEAAVILFAGKFEEKKRPIDLLHAFLKLNPPATDSRPQSPVILFVGSGPLESDLLAAAAGQIGKSVFFAPFQNQTEMPKVYTTGDVLVLPSFGQGETWGLAVNEAMNLARPVIVSSHVGCAEDLVIVGETGWIFPAGDTAALRNTLEFALSDLQKLGRMGLQAKAHVAAYSYQRATEGVLEVIAKHAC